MNEAELLEKMRNCKWHYNSRRCPSWQKMTRLTMPKIAEGEPPVQANINEEDLDAQYCKDCSEYESG